MKLKKTTYLSAFFLLLSIVLLDASCKKEHPFPAAKDGILAFSEDTVVFDTVFTTIGSTTQNFRFYNTSKEKLNIDEIRLMGGSSSPFRLNIDGISGDVIKNVEMLPRDSLWGFVEVTLQVNNQTLPMIVEDSIRFMVKGKAQFLKLAVWGQDAYFHYNDFNEGVWPNDKPHVIYGSAIVDSAKTLIIQKGTKIYLHKASMLFNYKGTLKIEGEKGDEVQIMGDRLEDFYKDVSGQFYGIYMDHPLPSTINYLIEKNGTTGIHVTGNSPFNASSDYSLTLTNSILTNNSSYGLFLYDGAKAKVQNSVISQNGMYGLLVLRGAAFDFTHCDIVGYGQSKNSAVAIKNYYDGVASNIPEGNFNNTVIYGVQDYELAFDTVNPNNSANLINVKFNNCVIRYKETGNDFSHPMFSGTNYFNQDPKFTSPGDNNFKPLPGSSLLDRGNPAYALPTDIDGNPRNTSTPDIGAYEVN